MKVRHSVLEDARRDPGILRTPGPPARASFSRARALQYAIYQYHDHGLDQALSHLAALYTRNFKNSALLRPLEDRLRLYDSSFQKLGNVLLQKNFRINFPVTSEHTLVGEIP